MNKSIIGAAIATAIGNIVGALYGLLSDDALENAGNPRFGRGLLGGEHRDTKLPMSKAIKTIAIADDVLVQTVKNLVTVDE